MEEERGKVFYADDGNVDLVRGKKIAVLGYGNQGRSQALNLRDSGLDVIIGNRDDAYRQKAAADGFSVLEPKEAVRQAEIIFLFLPDEDMPAIFHGELQAELRPGQTLVFASGYNIAFNLLRVPAQIDVIMITPRMIGPGVRERYLTGEGFFSFIGIHRDASGRARSTLLALAKALGALKAAVFLTFKDEAILDLFNEQAFGPAFGRVLLDAIDVLITNGLPPEAVLIEMYMSEEMAYTYRKMARVGLVKQVNFHSHTSQYGSMSRGIRYLRLGIRQIMQKTFEEIENGAFAREWQSPAAKMKFKVIKYFAMRQKINRIEEEVRKKLKLKSWDIDRTPEEIEELLQSGEMQKEVKELEQLFDLEG